MKGGAIFLIFLATFGAAAYAIPTPMFPGNMIFWFMTMPLTYAHLVEALTNGVVYGFIVWLVSMLIVRKFEEPKVSPANAKGT